MRSNTPPPATVTIVGYGVFEIKDIGYAPEVIKRNARYGDLKALHQPETDTWLPTSYMQFLRA